jgi:excisionase family DNA binding protein
MTGLKPEAWPNLIDFSAFLCYNCNVQMKQDKNLYTPTELSKILKVSRQEVIRRIWRGFIKAEKVGNQYIITKAEVNKAIKNQKAKG